MKVKVITAYVNLPVIHLDKEAYAKLGERLVNAVGKDNIHVFNNYPLQDCWMADFLAKNALARNSYDWLPHADSRLYPDRYAHPHHMVLSACVQHQRTQWAMEAAAMYPDHDCFVWIDYGVLKQGDFTGNPVTEQAITNFIERLSDAELDDVPFPGIWDWMHVSDEEANWRFCGSTHIWPRKHLTTIHHAYRRETFKFIERTGKVPYDMTIWAAVERLGIVPYRWYKANHDNTQFTNFKPVQRNTPLCELARKYGTDKCDPAGYTPIYHKLLKDKQVDRVLEIGICAKRDFPNHRCGASLWMWAEYFPKAVIIGIDIDPESMVNEGNIKSFICDQSNADQLRTMFYNYKSGFDLIVDDGSHNPIHQLVSMHAMLPCLNKGGLYIIEDIGNWLYPNTRPEDLLNQIPHGYVGREYGELPHKFVVIQHG